MIPLEFTIYTDIFIEASKNIRDACDVNSFISSNVANKSDISTDVTSELNEVVCNNLLTKITSMRVEGKKQWKI
jgi:hypothetical protein